MQDMPDGEKQEGDERTIAHLLIDQMCWEMSNCQLHEEPA